MKTSRLILVLMLAIAPATLPAQVSHEAGADPAPTPAAGTPAPPPAGPAGDRGSVPMVKPASAPQPLICRTTPVVGSLVAKHKQCLTKAQWSYVNDANEAEARRMMQDNMNRPFCDAHC